MTRIFFASLLAAILTATPALADGHAAEWQINFQNAASTSAERIQNFHNFMLWIITAIVIFVMALLLYVMLRFNRRANPNPSQTTHNVLLEIIWTVIPIVILIIIAVPSFQLLYYTDRTAEPDMTLKVTGYQWYWGYEYPDQNGINFQSYMIPDKDIDTSKGQLRLLSTDNPIVLPVDTNIQILTTAADVIHSFAVPALGVKIDAMPGHTNETWVRITKPGTYFGQCSELCGKDHAYMPIEIRAVPKEEFNAWVDKMKGGETKT
ncbi:MAG: cytochrome c oxidase subunit II [Alphaproteobacteria bacterium]